MTAHIKKWGNSSAIRLPADIMAQAGLCLEDAVTIRVEDGKVVIESQPKIKYSLEELLKDVTPDQLHEETDWGQPVGNEFW